MELLNEFLTEVVANCTKCKNCTFCHCTGKTKFCFFAFECIRKDFSFYQERRNEGMKYKCVIMQELEDTNIANPYLIVKSSDRAEELCLELESQNPGFIFWWYPCAEE